MAATQKRTRWPTLVVVCGLVLAAAYWLTREAEPRGPTQPVPPQEIVVLERREAEASDPAAAGRDAGRNSRRARSSRPNASEAERIVGTVTDRRGDPLPGARVAVRAKRGPLSASLGSSWTSASGEFTFELVGWSNEVALRRTLHRFVGGDEDNRLSDPDPLAAYGAVRIELTATFEGLAPSTTEATLAELLGGTRNVQLRLDDGFELAGYVNRNSPNSNRRVAGVRASLLDKDGSVVASAIADASARFLLRAPAGRYDLFVRHELHGTALVTDLDLTTDEPRTPLTVELHHARKISGRVQFTDGTPVANLPLEASQPELAEQESPDTSTRGLHEREDRSGLARGLAFTDAEGRFSFASLRDGPFQLRVPGASEHALRAPPTVHSGATDLVLTYLGQRLRVDLSDVDGSTPLDAQLECWRIEKRFDPAPERELFPHGDGRGTFYVEAWPGERLYLRAFAAGSPFAWTILDIDAGGGERRVNLRLGDVPPEPSDDAPGLDYVLGVRVALEVLDEQGVALDGWRAMATSELREVPAGWTGRRPAPDGSLPPLPPGRFRLELVPLRRDSFHCFASVSATVEAVLGSPSAVSLRVPLGGRLQLRMPVEAGDLESWQSSDLWDDLAERGWSVEAEALDTARPPCRLRLVEPNRADFAGFLALPGWDVEASPALLPGRYRLHFTRQGSNARSLDVTLRAGELTTAGP